MIDREAELNERLVGMMRGHTERPIEMQVKLERVSVQAQDACNQLMSYVLDKLELPEITDQQRAEMEQAMALEAQAHQAIYEVSGITDLMRVDAPKPPPVWPTPPASATFNLIRSQGVSAWQEKLDELMFEALSKG